MSDIVYDPTKDAWCHLPSGSCSAASGADRPGLPTYATVADVLEQKNGSGIRLLGWTLARAVLIAVPFKLALYRRVSWGDAFMGAAAASAAISVLTILRISKAGQAVAGVGSTLPRTRHQRQLPAPVRQLRAVP